MTTASSVSPSRPSLKARTRSVTSKSSIPVPVKSTSSTVDDPFTSTSQPTAAPRRLALKTRKIPPHDDKENLPLYPVRTDLDINGSPTLGRTGISKSPCASPSKKKSSGLLGKRIPLRELSEYELFIRDEAVLGDVRRRISGELGYIEMEPAEPVQDVTHTNVRPDEEEGDTTPEPETDDESKKPQGRHWVYRDPPSAKTLRDCLQIILADRPATPNGSPVKFDARDIIGTPFRIRQASVVSSPSTVANTPRRLVDSPLSNKSPVLGKYTSSPIRKLMLDPSPLKDIGRLGLVGKTTNTIIKEAIKVLPDEKAAKKTATTTAAGGKKTKRTTKPLRAQSSLRRAVGPAPSARSQLADIRKMR